MAEDNRSVPALDALHGQDTPAEKAGVVLTERRPLLMLNLRGGRDPTFYASARTALGCDLPVTPNASSGGADGDALWLGPDEWLLVAGPGSRWSEKMRIAGGTLTDVSHGRSVFRVSGARVRDALSKGCMLDLHPQRFPPRMCAQTGIARINVVVHRPGPADDFDLYAPGSYAGTFRDWLAAAAAEYGCHHVTG